MRRAWRMILVAILWMLLVWLVRFTGLALLLWFGCRAVADGALAGDWPAFMGDTAVAAVGWLLLADVHFNADGRGR